MLRKIAHRVASRALSPLLYARIKAVRSRRYQVDLLHRTGRLDQVRAYLAENGTTVKSGPFSGMEYPIEAALGRWSVPKLLGTYESELHPILAIASARKYDVVIDIGSAEGYYSVGLARLLKTPVLAYDPEPAEQRFTRLMAESNGVSHLVSLADLFTVEEMRRLADRRAFVISDCEGFEEVLFRPETLNYTRNWDIVIELHGAADRKLPELEWPHSTTIIDIEERLGLQCELRAKGQRFLWCDSAVRSTGTYE